MAYHKRCSIGIGCIIIAAYAALIVSASQVISIEHHHLGAPITYDVFRLVMLIELQLMCWSTIGIRAYPRRHGWFVLHPIRPEVEPVTAKFAGFFLPGEFFPCAHLPLMVMIFLQGSHGYSSRESFIH